MILALLFFVAFCVAVVAVLTLFARGRSRTRITGDQGRSVDYDNPYGRGSFFWTNRHPR